MKQNTMDMPEGNAVKLLLIFSIPMLIGNIFQQIYNLADIIIVGRLIGKNAIASIGVWGIWWSVGVVWALAGITAYWRYLVVKKQIIKQYGYN